MSGLPRKSPQVAIIGTGPAGLMAAGTVLAAGLGVRIFEQMPAPGRKFLMAGRGGLNLTHSEAAPLFIRRYGNSAPQLRAALMAFGPADLRAFAGSLGQETFIGSSGRVFPKAMKASPMLRAWLARLREAGATFAFRHAWRGWDEHGRLVFAHPGGEVAFAAEATILALGGATWPRLGSDGLWQTILAGEGRAITPIEPDNCGLLIPWTPLFMERFVGIPIKRIRLQVGSEAAEGDAMITRTGLEGGPIYALGRALRAQWQAGNPNLFLDLLPNSPLDGLAERLGKATRPGESLTNRLRKQAGLSAVAIGLLREAATEADILGALDPTQLAARIKRLPLRFTGFAGLERAISSAGGLQFSELDAHFMLKSRPGTFVAGEMLDWDAPTGGYLLQACFATGLAAGRGAIAWLNSQP